MWKANGKTTTLLLFLDGLFQKQRQMPNARCFLWSKNGRGYGPVVRQTTE
jgi:hypothetical protein